MGIAGIAGIARIARPAGYRTYRTYRAYRRVVEQSMGVQVWAGAYAGGGSVEGVSMYPMYPGLFGP